MFHSRHLLLLTLSLSALLALTCASCIKHVKSLPSGPITITGEVNDARGLPLSNNHLLLFRKRKFIDARTDASGHYAFPNLAAASYLLIPKRHECDFLPRDADLDNLKASVTEDFGGAGKTCGGEREVNAGAVSGPLTISGHIRNAAGLPIVGVRVNLTEHEHAVRFTGLTGNYSFQVKPGDYDLRVEGGCVFTPAHVHKDDLKASAVQDFSAGSGCVTTTATQSNVNPTGSVITMRNGSSVLGTTYVRVEQRSSAVDALARIQQIVMEQPTVTTRSLTIAGDPAIERQTPLNLPGPEREPDVSGSAGPLNSPYLALTTAIAAGNSVVRFESQLPPNSDAATIGMFFLTGRNFTAAAINDLHGPPAATVPTTRNTPPSHPTASGISAAGLVSQGAFGELQIASSDTANVVIYGTQSGPFLSLDGGQTVNAATYNTVPAPPNTAFASLGDPTVAVGAPNSSFQQTLYFAQLEQAAGVPAGGNVPIVAAALYQSVDNGTTFNFTSFPVNCSVAAAGCVVPDQEQLAADRITRAVNSTGSSDQLYVAWRNFTAQNSGARTIAVACSLDGGLNWNTDLTTLATTGADDPRLNVGPDGTLLVAYEVSSGATYSLNVQKWSSCASGFKPGSQTQVVKTVTEVTDMPGLDRPPAGNYLPAFDDSDGSAQTVFLVYANEPSAGNDDIHVVESKDGGATWTHDSIVNTTGNGRRYFPWICSTVGKKFVTWYDRRNSTAAKPDLTAYYRSSVSDNGSASSVGIGAEVNVSGVDDPQCVSGFPNQVRGAIEITGCNNIPNGFIQGGACQAACGVGVTGPCGSLAACDFRAAVPCANPAETCQAGNNGVPKYGDYNGAGCSLGTLFVAWASSTPPPSAACLVNGTPAASAAKCCSGNLVGGTCAVTAAACTATGNACGGGVAACCSGNCQAGKCLPSIALYTGSSCIGPACAGLPVTITYHQTGACNGYVDGSGAHATGPNAAYVFLGIESIDNSGGTSSFSFDPSNLFVQQAKQEFFDSSLSVYAGIFGPFAIGTNTLTPGQNLSFAPVAQGALVVSTTNPNGSIEANSTAFFLQYNRQPTDPPIKLVKSDASRTSWPNTEDCLTITLH